VDAASASVENPTKLRNGLQIVNRQRGAWVGASTWRAS
jgi:hypothetical protein